MPLKEGYSNATLAENIDTLLKEGKPLNQAIAISLDIQNKAKQEAKSSKKK